MKKKAQSGLKIDKPSFEEWYKTVPKEKNYMGDYNLRAAYENLPYDQMVKFAQTSEGHLPDTYKLPNHPTFSNESIYYQGTQPGIGGYWNEDNYIPNPLIGPPVEPIMKNGGKLTASKAKEILKDGTANGQVLTSKQKKYFGWAAGGSKANNGVNLTGYLDGAPTADNPYNIIPGQNGYTPITMNGVSQPIYANGQYLPAQSGDYLFPGNQVFETPAQAQNGAAINVDPGQQFNPWLYQDPYQQTPFPQQQMSYNTIDPNIPQPIDNSQSGSNYGNYIQKGVQFAGDVLDTIGGVRKSLIKGGASILNALIPDNQPQRDFVPITNYNRDAYGSQQYNNMFENGGTISINPAHRGLFTQKAKEHDMGVQEYANYVLSHKDNFNIQTERQAQFAHNFNDKAKNGAVVTNYGYNEPIPGLTPAQEAALNKFVPYKGPQQQSTYSPPATTPYTFAGDQRDLFTKAYRNSSGQAQSGTNYSGQMWGDYSKIALPVPGQNDPYGQSYLSDPNGGFRINTNLAPTRFAYNTGQPYQMQFGGQVGSDGYMELDLTPEQIKHYRSLGYDIQE